jgi:hypothetical protein
MKMLSKIITVIFLFSSQFVFSQIEIDKNGGSVYSIYGIGDFNYTSSIRTEAMGIMGLGLTGNYTNTFNPASWIGNKSTNFVTKFNLKQYRSSDGTNDAVRTYGSFDGFNLTIPANVNNGWIIDVGLAQYSIINYDIKLERSSGNEGYVQYYSGNGGLSRIMVGTSYLLSKNIGIGVQFNYVFGNTSKSTLIDFNSPSLYNTDNELRNSLSGLYFNTGLMFTGIGKVIKSKGLNNLNIGLMFSTPYKMKSDVTGIFQTSTGTDSISITEGELEIPWAGGIGIANTFGRTLTISADAYYQRWDDYKFYGEHPDEIKNSMRLGLGMEYVPSISSTASYFRRVAYRFGVSYIMDYLKINNEDINSLKVSAGLRLPVSNLNSLDLLLSYTRRGKDTDGLVLENIFNAGVSLNIGELWFLRPREE